MGPARVLAVPADGPVDAGILAARAPSGAERLLLRTWQPGTPGPPTRSYLTPDGARWIVESGARLLGIDSFSVDPLDDESLEAHRILLGAGIPILECLDLRQVRPGSYFLIAVPLRLESGDGSPVRALLRPLA